VMDAVDTKQKSSMPSMPVLTRSLRPPGILSRSPPPRRGRAVPDMIGDLLRQRGYEVDDWYIDVDDLKDLRGFGPIEHDFSKARTVVGTYRPQTAPENR